MTATTGRQFHLFCFFSKVFHVRSVTQGDVIRADAKDIPRIFQLLYGGEGEARRGGEGGAEGAAGSGGGGEAEDESGMAGNTLSRKGHDFLPITYHMPTTCEVCPRPLWHMFRPPSALECKRKCL